MTTIAPQHPPPPEHVATPGQLVAALLEWARGQSDPAVSTDPPHWPALYQSLAAHECCDDVIDQIRYRAWRSLSYANEARLDRDLARQLFPSPLVASVRQVETFAACPFKHFLEFGLGLSAPPSGEVSMGDLSVVYHDVLERLVRQLLRGRKDWADASAEWTREQVAACARQVGESLRGELLLSSARNRYLLDRVRRTLEGVVASQRALSSRGRLKTGYAGLTFKDGSGALGALRVPTPHGHELHVHGRIDRVDLLGDAGAAAVFDYRLGARALPLVESYNGLAIRLLTYLLVLQANGHQLAGSPLTPAAAFYLQLLRGLEKVAHPDDAPDPAGEAFHLRLKPRGVFDGDHLAALDSQLGLGESEVVSVHIKKDGMFGSRNRTDVATREEFAALLTHVRRKLGRIADAIIDGYIDLRPYKLGTTSACATCNLGGTCRFDAGINRYHRIDPMTREEVLAKVREEVGDGT